jgi:uncharacterized protein
MPQSISMFVVSVDKAGHVNQCLALADRMGWQTDQIFRIPGPGRMDPFIVKWKKRVAMWRALAKARRTPFAGPTVIIASGAASERVVAHARKILGPSLFAVFVGTPKRAELMYDIAISSRHAIKSEPYALSSAHQTAWISGILTRELAGGAPHAETCGTVILIGGTNKAYTLDPETIVLQIRAMKFDEKHSIILSRRTPESLADHIKSNFSREQATVVESHDRQGFLAAMNAASRFCVTPDSISMVCEALNTGKPVQVFDLPCFDADTSTARFMNEALKNKWLNKTGSNQATRPVETGIAEAIAQVKIAYEAWLEARRS